MDLLMDKLRSKASQYKSLPECAKAIRMSQLEKRFPMDIADRSQLQKCLDTLLQSMSVNSLQGMVERLESISRQLSLKLMAGQTGLELFISSDMFYLEVSLEPSGAVKDVKVHHEGKPEQQSCETLVRALSKGDFEDFTAQLEGLISIYQLNAEKKVKCKAFSALCALEADLGSMWSLYSNTKDVQTLLNTSYVGILEKRRGGHTMKLTYFVSPYDVLGAKQPVTVDYLNQNQLGSSVTICLEGSAAHKLQTVPIVTLSKSSKCGYVAAPLTASNSTTLPAYFSMKLSKPQPICVDLLKEIAAITELECADLSSAAPIFSLISRHVSGGKVDSAKNKGLFVNLPDQVHCYFMTECKGLNGVVVSSIPFTHPSHVPQILTLLKQQAVFNSLVASAVRVTDKQDIENMIMLEVSALSWRQMSVTFEHPLEESIATLEMDLTDITNLAVKLYSTVNIDTQHMSKILQRCLSIPVTMRALIKTLESHSELVTAPVNGAFSSAPNGGLGGPSEPGPDFGGPIDPSKIKHESGTSNGRTATFDDFSAFSTTVLDTSAAKVKKRKHKSKTVVDDLEIIVESSSSDSEREDLRRVKKAKPALDPKTMTTPSVTITPITSGGSLSSVLSGMGLERRPGIEIIPLSTSTPAILPSSITITPIPSDKDVKKSRSLDDREKKKKRKREEDAKMGPPEKVPLKSDPLSKPVSVSIKPAIDSSVPSPRPTSPSMRKYTSSPTQFRDKPSGKSNPSPKHSPVYSSPKHSPKHGTSSPKQTSSGSGKPSLSAIKSASSPNPKNSETKKSSSTKEQRDRDSSRKSASSPKIKSSTVKLKQLDICSAEISLTNISPPPTDPKCPGNPLQRNRKGSLSAVIDKLKSAQEVVDPVPKDKLAGAPVAATITKIEPKVVAGAKVPDGVKNPTEYMVKPSLDGMKITINKTRSKDGSKGSKTHTGLKPGVVSGPASKKTLVPTKPAGPPKVGTVPAGVKSSLVKPTPKPVSKSSGSPKLPTDLSKKDPSKIRPIKPEKSIFKDGQRKGSPTGQREDEVIKAMKMDSGLPTTLAKPFDTKFQIPKLSARNNPATPTPDAAATPDSAEPPNNNNNVSKSDKVCDKPEVKVIELGTSAKASLDLAAGLKYQSKLDTSDRMAKTPNSSVPNLLSLPIALTNISPKLPMTSPNLPTTSLSSITSKLGRPDETDPPQTEVRPLLAIEAKLEPPESEAVKAEDTTKMVEKFIEPAEILLDFSSSQSLQAKLAVVDKVVEKGVASAAPTVATLLPPGSPQTTARSPPASVIDDDLMDEALVLRK